MALPMLADDSDATAFLLAELARLDESAFEYHEGHPGAKLRLLISVQGEDVLRLERIAQARAREEAGRRRGRAAARRGRPAA